MVARPDLSFEACCTIAKLVVNRSITFEAAITPPIAAPSPPPAAEGHKLRARIAAARPDLSGSAVHTCACDIEKGRSTFEAVAAGEPVTDESIRTVLELHRAGKEAEAAYKQGLEDLSRRTGRSLRAVAHLVQHARAGHRLGRA